MCNSVYNSQLSVQLTIQTHELHTVCNSVQLTTQCATHDADSCVAHSVQLGVQLTNIVESVSCIADNKIDNSIDNTIDNMIDNTMSNKMTTR